MGGVAPKSPHKSSSPSSPVRRVEDETFIFSEGDAAQPLPHVVNFGIVTADVLETVIDENDMRAHKVWSEHMKGKPFQNIVGDLFWVCYLDIFASVATRRRSMRKRRAMLRRIANNYGHLFSTVTLQQHNGDVLFPKFSNALAQCVFLALFQAYPRSRISMDAGVREHIIDVCASVIDGMRPSIAQHSHWMNSQDSANRRANAMSRAAGGKEAGGKRKGSAAIPGLAGLRQSKVESMPIRSRTRLLKKRAVLGHTPMMSRFLPPCQQHSVKIGLTQDVKARPLISDGGTTVRKCHSPRDGNGADGAEKPEIPADLVNADGDEYKTYHEFVQSVRKRAKSLVNSHAKKRAALAASIASKRREVRQQQRDIDLQCKKIHEKEAHEYSNYIVSKMELAAKNRHRKK